MSNDRDLHAESALPAIDRDALRALAQGGDSRAWRVWTAIASLGFFAGFYLLGLLTLALTAAVLWFTLRTGIRIGLFIVPPVIASYAFLRAFFLFQKPWKDPGPIVTEHDEPKLFAMIREVSSQVGAPMPDRVYLLARPNAFVAHLGGLMGLRRGRTVLGIGMPLLGSYTEAEIRAVLAHEFGHFYGGETRLSGVLYSVSSSCVRVITTMHETGASGWAIKPFIGYLRWFLRSSNAMRRRQELLADAIAARVAGRTAAAGALRKVGLESEVFEFFLRDEVSPLVALGRWPSDLYAGLRLFREGAAERLAKPGDGATTAARAAHPFDSHPSLAERLFFLDACPGNDAPDASGPATALLRDPAAAERVVTESLLADAQTRSKGPLAPVTWDVVGREIYVTRMQKESERMQSAWPAVDDGGIAGLLRWLAEPDTIATARAIVPHVFTRVPPRAVAAVARMTMAQLSVARISTVLVREHGGSVVFVPGRPLDFVTRDGTTVCPEAMVQRAWKAENVPNALRDELRAIAPVAAVA